MSDEYENPLAGAFQKAQEAIEAQRRYAEDHPSDRGPEGISAEATSSDGLLTVHVRDGRVSSVVFAEGVVPDDHWADEFRRTTNAALDAYETAAIAAYRDMNPDFDQLQRVMAEAQKATLEAYRQHSQNALASAYDNAARLGREGTR